MGHAALASGVLFSGLPEFCRDFNLIWSSRGELEKEKLLKHAAYRVPVVPIVVIGRIDIGRIEV